MYKRFLILAILFAVTVAATAGNRAEELGVRQLALQSPQNGELLYCQAVEGKDLPGKYALILFLHGSGERGSDNQAQLKHGIEPMLNYIRKNKIKAVVLIPQCPADRGWTSWEPDTPPSPETLLLLQLLDEKEKEFDADSGRVYITGVSMGGFGTWALLAMRPEKFAAAIPICGGGNPADAPKLVGLPIQVIHGGADRIVEPKWSRDMVDAIRKAGGSKIIYREFEGCGHDSWTSAYRDSGTWEWLFAQSK